MAEIPASRSKEIERDEELDHFQQKIDHAVESLKHFHAAMESDSVLARELAQKDTTDTFLYIKEIIEALPEGYTIILIAGDEEIPTYLHNKGACDFYTLDQHDRPVQGEDVLTIGRCESYSGEEGRQITHYVGDVGREVELRELAKALCEGASIVVDRELGESDQDG